MSPEQARGDAVDQRSDLFSLGSALYTLCTGRPPFRAESSYGVMRPVSGHTPTPIGELNPDIPGSLLESCSTANGGETARDPAGTR
jgi:eukaryotic-like serine/threonine-protein kinase